MGMDDVLLAMAAQQNKQRVEDRIAVQGTVLLKAKDIEDAGLLLDALGLKEEIA